MRITITVRHTEVDDDLRAHTRELVGKVVKLVRRPHHAQVIRSPEASSPGLVLAGYTARFVGTDRIHILGETEITYLASLDAKARRKSIETFLAYDLPCIIITKGQEVPEELLVLAREKGIPVIRTRLKTAEFYRRLKPFLDDAFAPRTTVH